MALPEKDIDAIVDLYAKGAGEDIAVIARTYKVTAAAVRYWLKKRGELVPPHMETTMTATDDLIGDSDEALGIGVEDDPDPQGALDALMANPALAKLIDAAVAARLAQMGAPAAAAVPQSEAFTAFTETLKHLIDAQALQQPGYIKPLPAEELDRRAAGYVEMTALLERFQTANTPPLWMVGDNGFFECTNALEFQPGDEIRTYLPPAEDFIPRNVQAEQVHAAMLQWIGGRTKSIGEQVEAAMIAAKQAPLISNVLQTVKPAGPVELVNRPTEADLPSRKRRGMGTIVPERRDVSAAERMAGPAGPTFVHEAA